MEERRAAVTRWLRALFHAAVMYPGVFAVSMRKYVYAVLLLAHMVPLSPASEVERE